MVHVPTKEGRVLPYEKGQMIGYLLMDSQKLIDQF